MNFPKSVYKDAYDAFTMMAGVTLKTRKGMDAALKALDTTFPQFGGMMMLEDHSGITQTELAQLLSTDTTNTMVICDSLQKKGRIRRYPDAHDRRVNRLELTEEGRSVLEKAKPVIEGYYMPMITSLTDEEWGQMVKLLIKLYGKVTGQTTPL